MGPDFKPRESLAVYSVRLQPCSHGAGPALPPQADEAPCIRQKHKAYCAMSVSGFALRERETALNGSPGLNAEGYLQILERAVRSEDRGPTEPAALVQPVQLLTPAQPRA